MTQNQQQIIDSLIAEFNRRKNDSQRADFNLIDINEIDEINNLHKQLTEDSLQDGIVWKKHRDEYIDDLIKKISHDLQGRLMVSRGDIATGNKNYSNYIFIHTNERAGRNPIDGDVLKFCVNVVSKYSTNEVTKERYGKCVGLSLERYVTSDSRKEYKDEQELFNCEHTKARLKYLLRKKDSQ
jgi:hypothetical protein